MSAMFENREEAGKLLAQQMVTLPAEDLEDAVVLALPRGGVPVGFEVARALGRPLDVLVVRKIGAPSEPEYGIGAVVEGGAYWIDRELAAGLEATPDQIEGVLKKERATIEEQVRKYRGGRQLPTVRGRVVILVDDGLATGVTARAAARFVRVRGARKVILAVPVCPTTTLNRLRDEVDQVICLNESSLFFSVSQFFRDFGQVPEESVMDLLSRSRQSEWVEQKEVFVPVGGGLEMQGVLAVPELPGGLVVFAHGSGSSRLSRRNHQVAQELNDAGMATLLFDLLTESESQDRTKVFDIPLLADRIKRAVHWAKGLELAPSLPVGIFGASTGAAAALWAASELDDQITAVVSRGGRPDLAIPRLAWVSAATVLLIGGSDPDVLEMNKEALKHLNLASLIVIPGASHLFEEPGALDQVSQEAVQWFMTYFRRAREPASLEGARKKRHEKVEWKNVMRRGA